MRKLEELKGLTIRVEYALAKLRAITDPAAGARMLENVEIDAYNLGCHDFVAGETAAPTMFGAAPILEFKWHLGRDAAELASAMMSCNCRCHQCMAQAMRNA